MPNPVKYSTTTPSGSLRKGNMAIGVNPNVALGPTSVTGFYAGITPPNGGYTIYQNKALQGPSIYVANNDSDLIKFTKEISGTTYTNAAQCLNYFATQTDKIVIASRDNIQASTTSGSVLNLNADIVSSYPTTSSVWYDLSGNNNNGALNNGPIFNSSGFVSLDNTDDYVQITSSLDLNALAATRNMTICFTAKKLFYGTGGNNYGDSMVLIGVNNGYNTGFRIQEINSGTPGTPFTGTPQYVFGAPALGNNLTALSPRTGQNTFSYVCFSQSGSSVSSFINGKFASSSFANPYSPGTSNGAIGRDAGFGVGWFGGYIGNFQIYDRSLSQTEILQNYYQAPIVTNGLIFAGDAGNIVSYESGSTTTYSLTGSINGSLINGVGYNNNNGGAWVMDGADDFMRVSQLTGSNFPQATGTISFWYYVSSVGGNTDFSSKPIFDGYDTSGRNHFFIRNYYESPNNIQVVGQLSGSGGAYIFAYNAFLPNDQWHNVVLTYTTGSNSSYQIYMDGVFKNSGTLGANPSTFSPNGQYCGFGGSLGGGVVAAMQGRYNSLLIYNRALTSTEIQQNFKAQKNRFGV